MHDLTQLVPGQTGVITALDGDERFVSRAASIGLTPGCRVEMVQNHKKQPVLVYARDSMIAIHRTEAGKIHVEVSV